MRFMRWLPDWREISSAWSIHFGVYLVTTVAIVTTTLAILDAGATRLTAEGDRIFSSVERSDTLARQIPKGDTSEALRAQLPAVDRRGYRMSALADTAQGATKPVSAKSPEATTKFSRPPGLGAKAAADDPRRDWYRGGTDTFTTVCVRLCDGAIRPISFSTTEDRFIQDSRTCQSGCAAPSRLYVYRNPGESIADMTDLSGQIYARLKTAYLFQTSYVANCSCRPQPWEQAATERHRVYALQEKAHKGDTKARAELKALGPKVAALTQPYATGTDVDRETIAATLRSRRPAPTQSASSDGAAIGRRTSQVVVSSTFSSQGPTVMRLGGSSSSSPGYRSSGSSSRDTGWKAKMFEPR